jgi:hypothetical protein
MTKDSPTFPRPAVALLLVPLTLATVAFNDFDLAPHNYYDRPLNDPMTLALAERGGDFGEARDRALVAEMLEAFGISPDSQVMVFSKTSLQRRAVRPDNPRAIYFNEDVYLGWIPGGKIEVASFDPEVGPVFFFEDDRGGPDTISRAGFHKPDSCIQCHAGSATNYLPGPLARSVHPDAVGRSLQAVASFDLVSHRVPLQHRWGGWYVTGAGSAAHMGNAIAKRTDDGIAFDNSASRETEDLAAFFDTSKFLRPGSDAVALLVFDHQVGVHQRLVESHYKVRFAAYEHDEEADWQNTLPEGAREVADQAADAIVRELLFCGEAPLPPADAPGAITGDPAFIKAFQTDKRTDGKGRSLKDFSLDRHLFQHRCSYMVYANAFTGLPPSLKRRVFARLVDVLSAPAAPDGFAHLGEAERAAILSILRSTVDGFPPASS